QLDRDRAGDVQQARPFADVLGPHLDAGGGERAFVAAGPVAAPVEPELRRRVADQRDSGVAELEQMARRQLASRTVVDGDGRERRMHGVDATSRPSARSPRSKSSNARSWRSSDSMSKTIRSYSDRLRPSTMPRMRCTAEGFVNHGRSAATTIVRWSERLRASELGR